MAFCRNCGKEVNDEAKFCAVCGAATGIAASAPAVNNLAVNAPDPKGGGTGSAGTNQRAYRSANAGNQSSASYFKDMVDAAERSAGTKNQNRRIIVVLIIIGIVLGALLPFHYVFGYGNSGIMVFPKKGLTFENTFITEETVNDIVDRYNNGNLMNKITMKNEPIVRKLIEKKIIFDVENKDDY